MIVGLTFEQTFASLPRDARRRTADCPAFEPLTRHRQRVTARYGAAMPDPQLLALLEAGTRRLVRTVDAMTDEQWPQPSLLPGWSRAHVVAHLTLNAEGLAARARGRARGAAGADVRLRRGPRRRHRRAGRAGAPSELRDRFLALDHRGRRVGRGAGRQPRPTTHRAGAGRPRPSRPATVGADAGARGGDPPRRPRARLHRRRLAAPTSWPCCSTPARRRTPATTGFTAHATDLDRSWTFGVGRSHGDRARAALWHGGRRAGAPATD